MIHKQMIKEQLHNTPKGLSIYAWKIVEHYTLVKYTRLLECYRIKVIKLESLYWTFPSIVDWFYGQVHVIFDM